MLLVLRHEPNVRLATIDENGDAGPGVRLRKPQRTSA